MSTPRTDIGYGSTQAIALTAGREIRTRLRAKAFRVMTLVMMGIVVAGVLILKFTSGGGPDFTVGVTSQSLAAPLAKTGEAFGETVEAKPVSTVDTGTAEVRKGKLDALLTTENGQMKVVVKKDIDAKLKGVVNAFAGQVALAQQITTLGGDPAKVSAAVSSAKAEVAPLEKPYPYDTSQLVIGIAAGVLVYMSLLITGQMVAQGVVEEKSSRVVELLLAAVKPWQLMVGKVVGIGAVGLIQMALIAVSGLVAGAATGLLPSIGDATASIIWLLVWFVLGFLAYALVFASMGALVSRQEDAASVVTPVLMFVIAGYVVGVSTLPTDPGNKLAEVLSILPPFAPTLMPMRLAIGGVPLWETLLSLVLMIAIIPGLVWLSARIYRNAIMRTGAKVKLRDALKAA
jgi:ABC-2 type transport system permease protein